MHEANRLVQNLAPGHVHQSASSASDPALLNLDLAQGPHQVAPQGRPRARDSNLSVIRNAVQYQSTNLEPTVDRSAGLKADQSRIGGPSLEEGVQPVTVLRSRGREALARAATAAPLARNVAGSLPLLIGSDSGSSIRAGKRRETRTKVLQRKLSRPRELSKPLMSTTYSMETHLKSKVQISPNSYRPTRCSRRHVLPNLKPFHCRLKMMEVS